MPPDKFEETGAETEPPPRGHPSPNHSQTSGRYANDPDRVRELPDQTDPHQA